MSSVRDAGQMIDIAQVRALIDPADLIVAHNAGFDRPFRETFSSAFALRAWACSVSESDWSARDFEGMKLGYLIGQAGYFHDGHRAVDDCFALREVLAQDGPEQSNTPFAEHSPFEMKDHFKALQRALAEASLAPVRF